MNYVQRVNHICLLLSPQTSCLIHSNSKNAVAAHSPQVPPNGLSLDLWNLLPDFNTGICLIHLGNLQHNVPWPASFRFSRDDTRIWLAQGALERRRWREKQEMTYRPLDAVPAAVSSALMVVSHWKEQITTTEGFFVDNMLPLWFQQALTRGQLNTSVDVVQLVHSHSKSCHPITKAFNGLFTEWISQITSKFSIWIRVSIIGDESFFNSRSLVNPTQNALWENFLASHSTATGWFSFIRSFTTLQSAVRRCLFLAINESVDYTLFHF